MPGKHGKDQWIYDFWVWCYFFFLYLRINIFVVSIQRAASTARETEEWNDRRAGGQTEAAQTGVCRWPQPVAGKGEHQTWCVLDVNRTDQLWLKLRWCCHSHWWQQSLVLSLLFFGLYWWAPGSHLAFIFTTTWCANTWVVLVVLQ